MISDYQNPKTETPKNVHFSLNIMIFYYFLQISASLPGTATAHQLVQAIRQKCTPDEVLNILNELPNPENENEMVELTYNPLKIDVFVQTLLNLGSKSFSHSFAAIAKFHQVFKVMHIFYSQSPISTRQKQIINNNLIIDILDYR